MKIINCTPHAINTNNGNVYPASQDIARVSVSYADAGNGFYRQVYGDVIGLPEPQNEVLYIVSALVFAATDRTDVIAPATGHAETMRDESGRIVSVPGFVIK